MSDELHPTSKLRWDASLYKKHSANAGHVKIYGFASDSAVLQQWWENKDKTLGEWRDVEARLE